jgi:TrbL/VirB6 plasmid conjugal transfer protein
MVSRLRAPETKISFDRLHDGQIAAYRALLPYRFKALRCGRRFGKTDFAKTWISQSLTMGYECAWFAPQNMTWAEVYADLTDRLRPILDSSSRGASVVRLKMGGRLDFWTLGNEIAGRGRRYHRIVIDEAAFAKDGDNRAAGSMMELWQKAIRPTLFDFAGEALVTSNSAGKNPDNFFYNICTDPAYGFVEFHATTADNPLLPKRAHNESVADWSRRREKLLEELATENDPLVYAQEYQAEFVDWAGVGFFSREKLLQDCHPADRLADRRHQLFHHGDPALHQPDRVQADDAGGFVLVPFGLFGRTAFLAEKVLGNVVSSGVKVLVLAVIVGIGSTIFGQFTNGFNNPPTISDAP